MNRLPVKCAGVHPKFWVVASLAACLALWSSAGTSNTWVNTAGGTFDWNADTNWSPATFPNSIDAVANLDTTVSNAQAISVNQQVTVGTLRCGTTNLKGQTISNGIAGLIVMSTSSGPALIQKDQNGGITYLYASLRLDSTTIVQGGTLGGAYELNLSSVISGMGGLIKTNLGNVYMGTFGSGSFDTTPNTYTGLTTVAGGTLFLNKHDGIVALPGDALVKTGAVLQLYRNNVIADTSEFTVESNGIFRLANTTGVATSDTIFLLPTSPTALTLGDPP